MVFGLLSAAPVVICLLRIRFVVVYQLARGCASRSGVCCLGEDRGNSGYSLILFAAHDAFL